MNNLHYSHIFTPGDMICQIAEMWYIQAVSSGQVKQNKL